VELKTQNMHRNTRYEKDENKKTKFWRWVNKAFTDSNLYNPGGKTVILVILKT
jgi:hypothetical protein